MSPCHVYCSTVSPPFSTSFLSSSSACFARNSSKVSVPLSGIYCPIPVELLPREGRRSRFVDIIGLYQADCTTGESLWSLFVTLCLDICQPKVRCAILAMSHKVLHSQRGSCSLFPSVIYIYILNPIRYKIWSCVSRPPRALRASAVTVTQFNRVELVSRSRHSRVCQIGGKDSAVSHCHIHLTSLLSYT